MSLKKDLAKEIITIKEEMRELESKRNRSMSALVDALINKSMPDEEEILFFRQYSSQIEVKRAKLKEYNDQLKTLI